MLHKVVFISHPIRGDRNSPERNADMHSLRQFLAQVRRQNIVRRRLGECEFVASAPYLLYAALLNTEAEMVEVRNRLFGRYGVRPSEVWFTTKHFCQGMCDERYRAEVGGLPMFTFGPGDTVPVLLRGFAEAAE